jgi:hypothetical protein
LATQKGDHLTFLKKFPDIELITGPYFYIGINHQTYHANTAKRDPPDGPDQTIGFKSKGRSHGLY